MGLPHTPRVWAPGGRPTAHPQPWAVATYSGDDSGVRLDISSGVGTACTGKTGREGVTTLPYHQDTPALRRDWGLMEPPCQLQAPAGA